MDHFRNWYAKNFHQIKRDYFQFLKFPSISADPVYKKDLLACADWLVSYFHKHKIKAELLPTAGYPIVFAHEKSKNSKAKTVLIYGHYDVQPVDPLELWKSPPFEPTERDGKVFARGALDDKGQIFYAVTALCCMKQLGLELPVNVKFCIEGEEESASHGLAKSLPELKDTLKADSLLIVDFDSCQDGTPAISLGARGLASLEVTLTGSHTDLHSGFYGGIAYNPNRALAELLAKLWDEKGRVTVPGFYDGVEAPTEEEKRQYTFSIQPENVGIQAIGAEKGKTLQEANWFLPTFEINGMFGGYTGAGTKTIIPAKATAKISCRLAKGQDPMAICQAIDTFLRKNVVNGMQIQVTIREGVRAFRGSPRSSLAQAIAKASSEASKKPSVNILSGASIPIIEEMMRVLNAEVVGMGYGLASDDIHAPNEHFDMARFEKGFLTVAGGLASL